jgi:hypothetical protein
MYYPGYYEQIAQNPSWSMLSFTITATEAKLDWMLSVPVRTVPKTSITSRLADDGLCSIVFGGTTPVLLYCVREASKAHSIESIEPRRK